MPDATSLSRLRRINSKLAEFKESGSAPAIEAAASAALEDQGFRHAFARTRNGKPLQSTGDLVGMMMTCLYYHLGRRDYVSAALMLWGKDVFTPEPHGVQSMWNSLFTERMMVFIGGGGLGKTFSPSAWLLLDWVLDPEWTRVQISSNTEDHLKKNLYADMVRLHSESVLPLPGVVDAESISLDKKRGMGIFLLTIPGGPQSKGKIRGVHTKPRPEHPMFGTRSRVRALIDEGQEVAQNVFSEIPNRFSTVMEGDVEHIKFIVCANPKDPYSPFGQNCKPIKGWDSISMADEAWRSERGWWVVSLNAMVHENVVARRVIFPGFVTHEGVKNWLEACSGDPEHPDMYTYVYGKFPPQGTSRAIVALKDLQRSEREWIFDGPTETFAFSDYAFTGDRPTYGVARSGRAIAWRGYDGEEHKLDQPAMKIQIDLAAVMERGDTQSLADEVLERNKNLSIKPHHYGDDMTGLGAGPHDIVRRQWKQKVGAFNMADLDELETTEGFDTRDNFAPTYGIHFGKSATSTRIAEEDSQLPCDMYDGIATEVWYAFGKLCEFDIIGIGRMVDPKTFQELGSRRGSRPTGKAKKLVVESKEVYKSRTGNPSPDLADAVTGVVHLARLGTANLMPRAKDTEKGDEPPREGGFGLEMQSLGSSDIKGFDEVTAFSQKD